jgi:hypothetical protein
VTDETNGANTESTAPETPAEDLHPLPPFHRRLVDLFFNPGRLVRALKDHPAWGLAMVVGMLLAALQLGLIPGDVWAEVQRQAVLRSGREMPEVPAAMQTFMRWSAPVFGTLAVPIMEFIFAGVVTLVFAFVMGDEGRYRQYLAILAHAWIIPGVVELLVLPLKIAQKNPQFTVSLGSFFFFLPEGYFLKVLNMMALSQIWAWLVVAAGAHAIDPKRKYATAATVLIGLNLAMAMIFAIFTPTTG